MQRQMERVKTELEKFRVAYQVACCSPGKVQDYMCGSSSKSSGSPARQPRCGSFGRIFLGPHARIYRMCRIWQALLEYWAYIPPEERAALALRLAAVGLKQEQGGIGSRVLT
eukprot:2610116-Rhodomonas_salina.1